MAESRDSLFEAPLMAEQERMIEAILFATADPMTLPQLAGRMRSSPITSLQRAPRSRKFAVSPSVAARSIS